jgi:hypothetical protein
MSTRAQLDPPSSTYPPFVKRSLRDDDDHHHLLPEQLSQIPSDDEFGLAGSSRSGAVTIWDLGMD